MRNSRIMKIITVIFVASVLVLSALAGLVLADGTGEAASRVTVVSKNAAYESKTQLVFALKCDDLAANEQIYLLFFEQAPEVGLTAEELFKSASYRKTAYEKGATIQGVEGCELIASKGIAAKNINSEFYILPVIRTVDDSGEEPVYTYEIGAEGFNYSVRAYAEEKLLDPDITDAQQNLYKNLIKYGDVAEKFFSDAVTE